MKPKRQKPGRKPGIRSTTTEQVTLRPQAATIRRLREVAERELKTLGQVVDDWAAAQS